MGLGTHGGGVSVVRWLAEQGARITVTDLRHADALATSLTQLHDVSLNRLILGRHEEQDFQDADVVVVNPAVKPDNHFVEFARGQGAKITSETELFLCQCPARIVGVTGTTGKSTTCAMLAAMGQAAGMQIWLGGNYRAGLLNELPQMNAADLVVMELSSFQLNLLPADVPMPQLGIVTNCSPNHLDWHGDWSSYASAKQRLLAGVSHCPAIILNDEDPEVASWASLVAGQKIPLSPASQLPHLLVPGLHNRQNARLALTAANWLGIDPVLSQANVAKFPGLEHRVEWIGTFSDRQFYNDSKATSVYATLAALSAVKDPKILLAGGVDDGTDLQSLAAAIVAKAKAAVLFGAVREKLLQRVLNLNAVFNIAAVEQLSDALAAAIQISLPGDAILLSPGRPSFDQFRDYCHRGNAFKEFVQEIVRPHKMGSNSPEGLL
jgi:UDP-N-acetylmuramoylalanine--D-glutamate ligase